MPEEARCSHRANSIYSSAANDERFEFEFFHDESAAIIIHLPQPVAISRVCLKTWHRMVYAFRLHLTEGSGGWRLVYQYDGSRDKLISDHVVNLPETIITHIRVQGEPIAACQRCTAEHDDEFRCLAIKAYSRSPRLTDEGCRCRRRGIINCFPHK